MDIKQMSKPTQKKTTILAEKNVRKISALSGLKKKKKSKKLLKEIGKEVDPSPDEENVLEVEGIKVLDNKSDQAVESAIVPCVTPSSPSKSPAPSVSPGGKSPNLSGSPEVDTNSLKDDISVITNDGVNSVVSQQTRPKSSVSSVSVDENFTNMPNQQKQANKVQKPQKLPNGRRNGSSLGIQNLRKYNDQDNKKPAKSSSCTIVKPNESLRWENALPNEEEEKERIRLYKINRRKRYLAAAQAKGLGWVANYRSNGSPMSEDSGIETRERESHSSSDNQSSVTDFGTIKGLGPSSLPGIKQSALVDC